MNYQTCTAEELAEFFLNKTAQAITQQMKYYQSKGNEEIVAKIKKARMLCKQIQLSEKLEAM